MLEDWVTNYGYPVLLVGTFFEGETILMLGGLAAQLGYLSLELVIACGFLGSVAGDQFFYFLGRRHGRSLLARRPRWQAGAQKVLKHLERHQVPLLLGFRFLYGLRTITPIAVGLTEIKPLRFILFNIAGASIWATTIGAAGYYFGRAIESVLGDIRKYELEVMGGIVVIAALLWVFHRMRGR
ncbi:MAG: DedA family protein [Gammaproteobacteria bacterium]|nr:DedA family protein [Gammaproteobacteria bacterium]